MKIVDEEVAQGSAELILLFGGMIVIALIAAIVYKNYLAGLGSGIKNTQLNETISDINNLSKKFP